MNLIIHYSFSDSFPSWVITGHQIYLYIYVFRSISIMVYHKVSNIYIYTFSDSFLSWFITGYQIYFLMLYSKGLPRWARGKESASAGETKDMGSIPGSRRSPGGGTSNQL